MKKVYLAGDMLKKGSQILREMEANQIRELGYEIHSPKDDKEINDKKNQTEESNNGLAEKIVHYCFPLFDFSYHLFLYHLSDYVSHNLILLFD